MAAGHRYQRHDPGRVPCVHLPCACWEQTTTLGERHPINHSIYPRLQYGSAPLDGPQHQHHQGPAVVGCGACSKGASGISSTTSTSARGGDGFQQNPTALSAALVVVIGLGSTNSLLYKIMCVRGQSPNPSCRVLLTHTHPTQSNRFEAYGEQGAFFVSTGVNALYILYGGLILYPRMLLTDAVTPEMTRLPKARGERRSV